MRRLNALQAAPLPEPPPAPRPAQVLIGHGQVRHTRLRPRRHAFAYPTFFLLLPMRQLQQAAAAGQTPLAVNRAGAISFHDRDHGDGRGPESGGALAWLHETLAQHGIHDADGDIWLHTYPRMLGYTFKPVSFWYCQRRDGTLRAVLVEVNNTFGERHCYLLDAPRYGHELQASKCFHVSPFCAVQGDYRFRFMLTPPPSSLNPSTSPQRTVVRIDHHDAQGPLLHTSVSGTLQVLDARALRQALWRYPAMTLLVMARIHWQALRLWCKRAPFFSKPEPPAQLVSRN